MKDRVKTKPSNSLLRHWHSCLLPSALWRRRCLRPPPWWRKAGPRAQTVGYVMHRFGVVMLLASFAWAAWITWMQFGRKK